MGMRMNGGGKLNGNAQRQAAMMHARLLDAADEVAHLLANYAKANHGHEPRAAGWVFPGAGVKRWREGGEGWGDVTGNLTNSIHGDVREAAGEIVAALSAGMEYARWLELGRGGKWAWLVPAVEENKAAIRQIIARHLRV